MSHPPVARARHFAHCSCLHCFRLIRVLRHHHGVHHVVPNVTSTIITRHPAVCLTAPVSLPTDPGWSRLLFSWAGGAGQWWRVSTGVLLTSGARWLHQGRVRGDTGRLVTRALSRDAGDASSGVIRICIDLVDRNFLEINRKMSLFYQFISSTIEHSHFYKSKPRNTI